MTAHSSCSHSTDKLSSPSLIVKHSFLTFFVRHRLLMPVRHRLLMPHGACDTTQCLSLQQLEAAPTSTQLAAQPPLLLHTMLKIHLLPAPTSAAVATAVTIIDCAESAIKHAAPCQPRRRTCTAAGRIAAAPQNQAQQAAAMFTSSIDRLALNRCIQFRV
jgi:hypothetical protein